MLTAERLSGLVAEAKKKAAREEINKELGDRSALHQALRDESPKTRKNAYRLCGALKDKRDVPELEKALALETTLFALPSLLLALGALGADEILSRYTPPEPQGPEQEKHCREIREALVKAKNLFDRSPQKNWDKLDRPRPVLCVPPAGFAAQLAQELEELGFAPLAEDGQVLVDTDDIAGLYRANGLVEALLPLSDSVPLTPAAIAEAIGNEELGIGSEALAYRISLLGYDKEKRQLISDIAKALGGKNNPSHYDCELRIVANNDCALRITHCALYLKPWNVTDARYPWRKNTIAASLHPATAACLCRWARNYERTASPRVLDPFCGSGTLLFAREALGPCRSLTGVDKQAGAVAIARENAAAGGSRAAFVGKDTLRFAAREPYDLVLANLPFGNRVGSHAGNEELYRGFVARLPKLLAPGGVAVLYTMEHRLLARCLQAEPALRRIAQKDTEAGGLLPRIFVIERTQL